MGQDELYEEIRALLFEAQVDTVDKPWHYHDDELTFQVRSALRYLRAVGVSTDAEVDVDGTFTTSPTETIGTLLAYIVASRLLNGDLIQKLLEGEIGIHFRAGRDVMDTKTAAHAFREKASQYKVEAEALMTIVLTDADGGAESIFGHGVTSWGDLS